MQTKRYASRAALRDHNRLGYAARKRQARRALAARLAPAAMFLASAGVLLGVAGLVLRGIAAPHSGGNLAGFAVQCVAVAFWVSGLGAGFWGALLARR